MPPREEDVGWRFGEAVDGNKRCIKCKFCHKIINGRYNTIKTTFGSQKR